MSENQNGSKLDTALITLLSRWFTVIGFPAMFLLSIWFGQQFVERMDSFVTETRQEFRHNDKRVNTIDNRLTGAERDILYLRGRQ